MPHIGARACDRLDLGARLGVDDQVPVDPRMRPESQRREIGDRADARHGQAAGAAHPPEHVGRPGIRRDDHVRPLARDQPQQAATPDELEQPRAQPAGGGEALDQPVLDVEDQRRAPQDRLRAAAAERLRDRAHLAEPVGDHGLGALFSQPGGQQLGGEIVPRADLRRQDQRPHHRAGSIAQNA